MEAEDSPELLRRELAAARARIAELESAAANQRTSDAFCEPLAAVDAELRFTWVNGPAEKLLGSPGKQVLGRTFSELVSAAETRLFEERLRLASRTRTAQEFEWLQADSNRWLRTTAHAVESGGLTLSWHDITDLKKLESDFRRQTLVLNEVRDSIIITDVEGKITQWSRGAATMFGYEAEEAIGQSVGMLYFEEDRAPVAATVLEPVLRTGSGQYDLRKRRKSGEETYVRMSVSLLLDEHDQPYGMLGISVDITVQRQTEQALRESEERYRGLANAIPQVAYVTGMDGRTEMINRHWEEYSGVSADECLDFDWLAWVHPDDALAVMATWGTSLESGQPFETKYRLRNRGGEYRWHLGRAVPIRGADGATQAWAGVATDIQALQTAKDALRMSEERFRLASQAIQGILYDWNLETGVVQRSGDLEQITGVAAGAAEETPEWWQERVHPADTAGSSLKVLAQVPRTQTSFETEFRFRHADGHWVDLCERGFIVRDAAGEPVRVVGFTQDISGRRQLERELAERRVQLEFQAKILATTDDAVVAVDGENRITYFSPAAERMYGTGSGEVLGQPLESAYTYSWLSPQEERQAAVDLEAQGTWKGENVHHRKDGKQLFVSSTVNVLPRESGGGGLVAVIRDISEKKKADLELRKQAAQLAHVNEDLTNFAYTVSHDLQAPLRTTISFSQLLELRYRDKLDDNGVEFVRRIVDASSRMAAMIRDLLQLATSTGGDRKWAPEVSLQRAAAEALENLGSEVRATGALVAFDSLPDVMGDAGQFSQLFQNLIGNSLKYRHAGRVPKIAITAARRGEEWVIEVRDNGIGFRTNQAEHIFGVFKRLHGGEYSGTGVGLAICKRIVERRGGRIWATGTPGEGAVFAFSVPDEIVEGPISEPSPLSATLSTPQGAPSGNAGGPFEELFQTLDLAPAMIRNLSGTILVWTEGAERLFGWTKQEALGRHLHELLKTEFSTPLAEIEAHLLQHGEWQGRIRKFTRNGSGLWVASRWALYRDGSGRPQSVLEVVSDITSLTDAEDAIQQSSVQRNLALRAGQMGTWRWKRMTGAVEWDETVAALHGMTASMVRTLEEFLQTIHADDVAMVKARIDEALEGGSEYLVEYRAVRADGSLFWIHGQGQVFSVDGEAAGLSGVAWDITRRKQEEFDREFLLDLSASLLRIAELADLRATATRMLGEYLGVARCTYGEVDLESRQFHIVADYHLPGLPEIPGSYSLDAFGELEADRYLAIDDTRTDPRTASTYESSYAPMAIRSNLSVPFHRHDVWRGYLAVNDSQPHKWGEREIALLRGTAERLWPALENARLMQLTRERQEQFEGTFEQAAVGIAHVGPDGRWLRVNQRIADITGYAREELLAGAFQQITHPDDLQLDWQHYEALKRGETQSYAMEKRYIHKNGSIVWVNLTVSLVRHPSGEPKYAISVVEDFTARKQSDRELAESNRLARLRLSEIEAIYSQAPIGLLQLDNELRFVRVNHQLARMNGVPIADHPGRRVEEVLPEVGKQLTPILKHVIRTRMPVIEREVRITGPAKAGAVERVWLVSYFPFEAADVLGINGVVQEITGRKESETAWLETSERLWIATASAQLGVFVWDAVEDRVFWENQRMYEITGRTREQGPANVAEFMAHVVIPEDAAGFERALNAAVKADTFFRHACRIRRGDGVVRYVEFSGKFDTNEENQPRRLTGVMADVTDRVLAERASRDRRQLLLKVLDSLYSFVGVMSPDGVLLEANRAPLEAAELEAEEVLGKALPETHWWSYSKEVQDRLWEAIHKAQTGEGSRFDIVARMKDGEFVTLDWTIAPLREDNGDILYLIQSAIPIEQRKQAELALRKSEERYLLAERATNDGLWDWDPTGDFCYFSTRFKALLGFTDEELENRARGVFARVHAEDAPTLSEGVRLHFIEDRPFDVEMRIMVKDGTYRWFRMRGKAVKNAAGEAVRMVGAMSDIHDRKQAETLTRANEDQLRTMIDSFPQLAWMAHADGYLFWYNRRWYEYTGTSADQMEGWGWQSVHDPEILPLVMERWTEAIRRGEPFEMEFPLRAADGEFRHFLTRVVPVRDVDGKIVRWFGTNTDIDLLRKEQDLLKESEQRFRELAEAIPEMMWVADPNGRTTYSNPQWYAYTGAGKGQGAVIHADDAAGLMEIWNHAVQTGQRYEFQARVRRHDGVYRWFLNRAEPLHDVTGRVVKWFGTSTDIHEQKSTEEELRRLNEDLEQFAFAASHDLQEPLRTLSVYSQMLVRNFGSQGEQSERFVRYIVNAAKQMEGLLKGILAYSRVGEQTIATTAVDSAKVLESAVESLELAVEQSGAVITHDELPVLVFPATHLLLLFHNLISNAIKYKGSTEPRIHVSASVENGWQKFAVSDNGIGIKEEYLQLIFGIFKRLYREEYPGVGVGLAICKRIVERQGGRIWAESEVGKGTTLFFTIPISGPS